jgi:hypothetical protein
VGETVQIAVEVDDDAAIVDAAEGDGLTLGVRVDADAGGARRVFQLARTYADGRRFSVTSCQSVWWGEQQSREGADSVVLRFEAARSEAHRLRSRLEREAGVRRVWFEKRIWLDQEGAGPFVDSPIDLSEE